MRKNYAWKAAGFALLFGVTMGLQSCDSVLENIDNPIFDPLPEEATVTVTSTGATFKIYNLDDISTLFEQVKSNIAAKGSNEFVIDIKTNATLATTATANTITIPAVAGSNITINVPSALSTAEAPLTIKSKAEETTEYTSELYVNLPNKDTDLVIDAPGTIVTINGANTLKVDNGLVIVKDGGEVDTYIYAPASNDYYMYNSEPVWVEVTYNGDTYYLPNLRKENGDTYTIKNLRVEKGEADFARIYPYDSDRKLEKLTIADGVTVVTCYSPCVNEIVGEGTATVKFDSWWWWTENDKIIISSDANLYNVESISNITLEAYVPSDQEGTLTYTYLYSAPADMENVTFKYNNVTFRNPEAAAATVKSCKFIGTNENPRVYIVAPYQTSDIASYKFTFDGCEFAENTKFATDLTTSKLKLDENGKTVYQTIYRWIDQENGNWYENTSLDNVPEANKAVGQTASWDVWDEETESWVYTKGYWTEQRAVYEEVEFKDFVVTTAFVDCKIGGEALTTENFGVAYYGTHDGIYIRYEIGGTVYRVLWDGENDKYVLIPA